ncbi:hypothetical protein LG047_16615 [Methylocystis sp. WRRC1]|uniref:hypothetical protein n=1 Tax=unclassified Methylocystis TaxID=2625913 RepID=UPI0001F87A0E|nr:MULTISPECIES: hypothetical protein [unclassified Methylocystis]MCC3246919.1 hypothetical protein [Methylocystis sp. WRRC1]
MSLRWAVVGAAGALALGGAPASATPKPKPAAPRPATSVNLENKRPVSLLNFEIVMRAADKTPETIVGKIDKPLAAGASATFPLNGAKGCMFEARWAFEDLKDSGDIDLCNDAHIVLVD